MPSNNPLPDGGGGGVTDHGALTGLSDDDHTQYSLISSQAGAPGTTPSRVGLVNIDTTTPAVYVSTGTSSSADWTQCDGTGGGGDHGALAGLADDDHTQYPLISSGAGVPGSTPSRVGLIYVDTTNDQVYMSTDTASSADWDQVTNFPVGISSVLDDLSPQLGGNLDGQGNNISNVGTVTATGDIFTQTGLNLTHIGLNNTSTSILEGGLLTVNGVDNTKYDISDGTVCIADNFTDPSNPTLSVIEFTGLTSRAVTDITNDSRSYVGIRLDNVAPTGGTATAITVTINGTGGQTAYLVDKPDIDFTLTERREIAVLGLLPHPSTFILFTLPLVDLAVSPHLAMVDLAQSIGPINRTGNVYSANGANLQINKSAGETFRIGTNYADTAATRKAPNITTDAASVGMTYRIRYQDGLGGFTETGDLTNIDPDQYDDGTGTLASVANNKWTIQWLFYFGATDSARFQYGQTEYNSFAAAEEALLGGTEKSSFEVDPNFLSNATLRGWLIVKKGATDLSDSAQAQFLEAGRFEQTVVGGGTTSTTTLQQAYDNSVSPEITTTTALGALSVKRGSAADTDDVLEVQNGAGTQTFAVDGNGNVTTSGTVDGRDIATDGTKLDGIESGATADQTGAEIKVAYEAEADTNAYTDAEKTKLAGISAGAEVNAVDSVNTQTGAVVLDADDISDAATTNKFTTAAEISKLSGIESGATADQTGAEIKSAYEAEADTNAFTDADHSKLDGIEASATANPRSALSIFEATLSSATQNCNGTQGSTFDFTWTTSVNNSTYITSFTNGNSVITLTEAGEYLVDAQIIILNSALTGRLIFTGQIIHQNSTPTTLWDQTIGAPYIRDTSSNYDSGGLGGQQTIFASAGDRIILRRTVLDTANSASNVYASQTDTKIRIQKID